MAIGSFIFDPSKGETPETVAARRKTADTLAARIFGRAPQNVGEGLNALGQAWIASTMRDEANSAQKAGQASAADAWKQFIMGGGEPPSAPAGPIASGAAAPMGGTSIPSGEIDPRLKDAISNVASVHPDIDPAYMTRLALVENGGKVEGGSPLSSAQGPFQFLKGTAKQYGLTNPNDPTASADAAARLTMDNRTALTQALGREPTPGELYLAHQQGAGGAIKLLQNPNAPVESVIGMQAARNNAGAPGMTAGQFANRWTGKFNDIVQTVDPNQKNIIDEQADMPIGAPAAVAGGAPAPVADDGGVTIPPNAQAAQGQLPTAQDVQAATQPQPNRSGYSVQQLMQLSANPWLNDGQRAAVNLMLKQELQQQDPMRQLQIQKLQADIAAGKSPESVREFEYAKKNGFEGSFQDWIASKRAGAGEYGLNPIWGKGPDGKPAIIQLGKSGKPILTPLPDGFEPGRDGQRIDLGTEWGILDPTTRQLVGRVPKDLRGAEREKGVGEAQGKALASAPADIQSGQNAIDILDKIEKSPYLERGTGFSSLGNVIPGTGGYDFSNIVEQAKSGAFLQAIQQMRGLGSLSNAEGGAATAAVTRMNTFTSREAFLDALADYRKIITQGMARAQSRLNHPSATNPTGAGVTINGYKIEAVD